MTGALASFLGRNTVVGVASLPLVHTTRSYNIGSISKQQQLDTVECDVFSREPLTYFFVGRPAYKRDPTGSEASYWELPCCFIFEAQAVINVRRVFPFDSGAFTSKLYPSYVNLIKRKEFELRSADAPSRIIGSFFGSARRYFDLKPKSAEEFNEEYELGPLDAEVKALQRLAADGTPKSFDDRRFAIEVQSAEAIDFTKTPPIAVILPSIYLRDETIRSRIIGDWKAEPITYEIYSLSQESYDGIIYAAVEAFYKQKGFL